MAEGDSVHRTARWLDRALTGRTVVEADLRVAAWATAELRGWTVTGTVARGKNLLTRFDSGWTLHTHHRMTGSWTVLRAGRRLPRRLEPDLRVRLALDDGRTAVALSMPVVALVRTAEESSVVGHLGPDPLGPDWDAAEAARRLAADPARPLVEALLDQRVMAGPGNLWVVETCYLRGAWPWTPVGSVDVPAVVDLVARMMRHSLEHRTGMTTTGDTRPGRSHWVYGRAGRPCLRCGTPISFRPAGAPPYQRETWWCPHCQPAP